MLCPVLQVGRGSNGQAWRAIVPCRISHYIQCFALNISRHHTRIFAAALPLVGARDVATIGVKHRGSLSIIKVYAIGTLGIAYTRGASTDARLRVVFGTIQYAYLTVFLYSGRIKRVGTLPSHAMPTHGARKRG